MKTYIITLILITLVWSKSVANDAIFAFETFKAIEVEQVSRIWDGGSTRFTVSVDLESESSSFFILKKIFIGEPERVEIWASKDKSFKKYETLSDDQITKLALLLSKSKNDLDSNYKLLADILKSAVKRDAAKE